MYLKYSVKLFRKISGEAYKNNIRKSGLSSTDASGTAMMAKKRAKKMLKTIRKINDAVTMMGNLSV